jgi:DNA-binding MarR family transcriptional regulator
MHPDDQVISAIIRARRKRAEFFPLELFSDPAWDVLLALLEAKSEGRSLTLAALAKETGQSATLVVRWVDVLCQEGLVDAGPGSGDLPGSAVDLSQRGCAAMQAWLDCAMQTK